MIVVCANDYPHCVLPASTTMDEAYAFAKKLQEQDPVNVQYKERYPMRSFNVVRYHVHDVPEVTP